MFMGCSRLFYRRDIASFHGRGPGPEGQLRKRLVQYLISASIGGDITNKIVMKEVVCTVPVLVVTR